MSLLDFAGGAADFGSGLIGSQIKSDQELDRQTQFAQMQAQLEMERQKAMEQFKVDQANAQRQAMVGRVNDQLNQDADQNSTTPAAPLPTDANGVPVQADGTPMPQEAIDQYNKASGLLNSNRQKYLNDSKNILRAQVETGDAKASDLANVDSKNEIASAKNDAYLDKLTYLMQKDKDDNATKLQIATLTHMVKQAGGGNTDFDKKVALWRSIGKTDAQIADLISERKQPSVEELAMAAIKNDPNAGTPRAITPEQAVATAQKIRAMTAGASASPASPAAPAATTTPKNRPSLDTFKH